jgi:ribonuclease HII
VKPTRTPLLPCHRADLREAGVDEAGRGCLAGPVTAGAVILPPDYHHPDLNDSKQLTARQRNRLRTVIEQDALAWAVAEASPAEIDALNILQASFLAMHRAVTALSLRPEHLLIDGNRFVPYADVPHLCVVRGDAAYLSIAAASILAKTHRDEQMSALAAEFPYYGWADNAGYPTERHLTAIREQGPCVWHRRSFRGAGG